MRAVITIIVAVFLTLWLMVWPTAPGPYEMSAAYAIGTAVLLITLSVFLRSSKDRAAVARLMVQRKRVLLPLFGVLAGLLLSETVMRLTGAARWWGGEGPRQTGLNVEVVFNQFGNRGPEVTSDMRKNKRVLLGLGDSFLFGGGLEWEDTFLQQLEKRLIGRTPVPVITVNTGIPGLNTRHQASFLSRFGASAYKPSIVLVEFTLNDAEIDLYRLHPLTPWTGEKKILWRSHLFFRLVQYKNARTRPYDKYILSLYEEDFPGWRQCRQALKEIRAVCRGINAVPLLVIYPMIQDFNAYPYEICHQKVAAAGRAYGFEVIDLLEAFRSQSRPAEALRLAPGDNHPNAEAHAIASAEVASWIVNNRK